MNIKKEIKKFLDSKKDFAVIEYKPKRMTAAAEWYKFKNPIGMVIRGIIFELVSYFPPSRLKNSVYRLFGVRIGRDVTLSEKIYIDPLFPELISIDDGAIVGTHSTLPAHGISQNKVWLGRTKIGKLSVIGAFSWVKPGTKIGEHVIVAANSTVTKDVKKWEIVGNPIARRIGK